MTIPLTLRQQKGSPLAWSEVDNNFTALRNGIESVIAPAGMRNLLINGNFQINQRGYVSGAATTGANQYTLDRWRVVTSGQNVTFSASGNGNQITAPAGGIEQVIEGINIGGGTYVLNWTGTATATVNGTARAKGESFTLPANTNATVRLIGGTASQVQLEPGTVATPFEHRPIGAELALCQRYACAFTAAAHTPINGQCGGLCISTTAAIALFNAPVPMRALPQISLSAANTFGVISSAGVNTTVSAVSVVNYSMNGPVIHFTSTGLVAGNSTLIYAAPGQAASIILSAEL